MNRIINNIKVSAKKSIKHPLLRGGLVGLLVGFCLSSCTSNEDTYEPASPVSAECIGAYFPSTNKSEIIKADTDEKSFEVTVKREKTESAVSIPIKVISKTDNITVPATVDFAAGADEASITLSYTDLETTPKFDIKLDEAYTNPYKIKDGSMEFAGNVFRLNLISDSVVCKNYDSLNTTIFRNTVSSIYQMGSENKFIWRNFLGSGIDLKFKFNSGFNSDDVFKSNGDIIPLDHYYEFGGYGWCVMADEEGNYYLGWDVENGSVENWMYIYYEYEGSSYFGLDLTPTTTKSGKTYGWGYIWSACIDSWSTYDSSQFYLYY